ncbi:hypothetical protein V6X30_08030 [Spiribacter sp. 1M189]|uniref:Uncharacterized protein n=1 Tax=Spiribacter insolitus TaxID=3122417 RepID=A0ABV3T831_9GAMM
MQVLITHENIDGIAEGLARGNQRAGRSRRNLVGSQTLWNLQVAHNRPTIALPAPDRGLFPSRFKPDEIEPAAQFLGNGKDAAGISHELQVILHDDQWHPSLNAVLPQQKMTCVAANFARHMGTSMLDEESAGAESGHHRVRYVTPIDCIEEPKIPPQPRELFTDGGATFE